MCPKIQVAILDDHLPIVDGFTYRLNNAPDIEVVATMSYGEELRPALAGHPTDVLLLDITVPTSPSNKNPYPVLATIPELFRAYPDIVILVISMHTDRALVKAVVEAGCSGYVLKEDSASLRELASVVRTVASGGRYYSPWAHDAVLRAELGQAEPALTARQLEALSLCAAYPNLSTAGLANKLGIANSTMRNLLSGAYVRLKVNSRAAAILKARQLGLITPFEPEPLMR
ncbi:MAG: response regulator transcription factor [Chloroflexi bacterium]|nr:response regulator transcription factor [Chloroflexota bacterium]